MFGLAGGKDAAYSNMSIQDTLSAAVMNLAKLAVQDVVARNNVLAGNSVSANQDVVGNSVTADTSIGAGSTIAAGGTIDAGGNLSAGEDVQASDGTVHGNSVLATDDGRFASLYLDGTEIFLSSFPTPLNGTFGYLQSLTVPPSFSPRYVQSYTNFVLNVDESLSFFTNNIPAGEYILNLTLTDGATPRALTYVLDGTPFYNPFSSRTNPFIYFTHPGGVLSVAFATEHGAGATIPVTSMILAQYVTPDVSPTLFAVTNTVPITFVAAGLSVLPPTDFSVVTSPQPGVTLSTSTDFDDLVLSIGNGPGTPSAILANAQIKQYPLSFTVTRTSGGSGSFFVTAFIVFADVIGFVTTSLTTYSSCVAIPDENVPVVVNIPLLQDRYSQANPTDIHVKISVAFTSDFVTNYYQSITPINTSFSVTDFSANLQLVLFPN